MVKTANIETGLLDDAISKSGLKIQFLAEKLGITRQAFDKKRKGEIAFRASEVYVMCDLLHLTEDQGNEIFFP